MSIPELSRSTELQKLPDRDAATISVSSPDGQLSFDVAQLRELQQQLQAMIADYSFALREVETKLSILRDEFRQLHDYNPIEHISTRVKSMDSLLTKASRKGIGLDPESMRAQIHDIAGARVTCGYISDVYELFRMFVAQDDVTVLKVKDYIAEPKANGYRSLHAVVQIPIYLSTGRKDMTVELQFRTSAMDFWASLEHKLHYKYDGDVPEWVVAELTDIAQISSTLDERMMRLHNVIHND